MTAEQYYWNVRRPQLMRARMAGFAKQVPVEMVTVSLTATNGTCKFKINGVECISKQVPKGSNVTIELIKEGKYELSSWSDSTNVYVKNLANVQNDISLVANLQTTIAFEGHWEVVPTSDTITPLYWDENTGTWRGTFNTYLCVLEFERSGANVGNWLFYQDAGGAIMDFEITEKNADATVLHTTAGGGVELHWVMTEV